MTDHAYVALIESPQQFDQAEDFLAALVRAGAGYANDIGVLDARNHFDKDSLLVLFTADRGLIDACFHLEFGFKGPLRFEHLDAFETDGDEQGAEIVAFHSLADDAGDDADTPQKVFAYVRGLKGWTRGESRDAIADPQAYDEAAEEWNRRLGDMLPVATIVNAAPRRKPATSKQVAKTSRTRKSGTKKAATKKAVPKKAATKKAGRKTAGRKQAAAKKSVRTKAGTKSAARRSPAAKRSTGPKRRPATKSPARKAARKTASRKTAKASRQRRRTR
jgi:hypothetical protein